jgi:hypothetical protein
VVIVSLGIQPIGIDKTGKQHAGEEGKLETSSAGPLFKGNRWWGAREGKQLWTVFMIRIVRDVSPSRVKPHRKACLVIRPAVW